MKLTRRLPQIYKVVPKSLKINEVDRRLPKVSEGCTKTSEDFRRWYEELRKCPRLEVFRRFSTLDRRVSEVSEESKNRGDIKLNTVTVF